MTTLTCVTHLLRAQFGLITLAQLRAAGFTRGQIRTLLNAGRLRRVHRGVFAVEGAPPTFEQRALAAVLACGPEAALSHLSAACHYGLLKYPPSTPDVTKLGTSGARGPAGINLHHARSLQIATHDHIPITTIPRTLNDIAPTLRTPSLKAAVRQAEIKHATELSAIDARGPLARFLETYIPVVGATNDYEADFLELCATYDIPRPLTQEPIGPYFPDFLWPAERLIVETDGRGSHDTYVSFREDRARARYLQSLGYVVLQFAYEEIAREPARVAAEITAALARRGPAASRLA